MKRDGEGRTVEGMSRRWTSVTSVRAMALEMLEAREAARGNRLNGLAALLFEQPHPHAAYDIEVDTTAVRPTEAAARIRAHVYQHKPRAFNEIAYTDLRSSVNPRRGRSPCRTGRRSPWRISAG